MTDKAQDLKRLIVLSEAMLTKAQAECWDEVIALESERFGLIRQFFSQPVHQAHAESVAAGIQAIQAMDEKLKELGALRRFDILQTLQTMENGKKAIKAYTS
jgi:Flagellar protein FliT